MPRRFLGTRQKAQSAVGDRLRSALVYEVDRPRMFLLILVLSFSCCCCCLGIEELIGSPDRKLQILKASVLANNGGPNKLVTTSPELLVPLEEYSVVMSITTEPNPFFVDDSTELNGDSDIDFTRVEDFFRLESKIDAKNDHSLLKVALSSKEGQFVHDILSSYSLPASRLAFIQQLSTPSIMTPSLTVGLSGTPNTANKDVLVSCQVCGEMFPTLHKFQRHILTHPDPECKKFLCQICGKRFNRADHLNRHSVLHGNVHHKCLLCGEEFDRASHLDRHRRKNHPPAGQAPSQTPPITPQDKVPRLSSSSMDMDGPTIGTNLHLLAAVATPEESHNKTDMVVSNILKATLEQEQQRLEQNNRPSENIERPYVCEVCDRKFIRSTHLRRHMRIHTGEKPFACHICGRRYARGDYLRAHINAHRRDRVHKCKHCNEIFHDLTRFADHCRQVHKDIEDEFIGQEVAQDMPITPNQRSIDGFNLYDDIQLLRVANDGPLAMASKIKLTDDMIMPPLHTRDISFHGTDFLQAFVSNTSQSDSHVVLQNGSLTFADHTGHEVTVMSNKNESLLDPLEHLIIANTSEALEVLQHNPTH